MELQMKDELIQGLIAAIVQHTESGENHGFRLEIRDSEGRTTTYISDTTMARYHTDPTPMSLDAAIRLIQGAGLRVYGKVA